MESKMDANKSVQENGSNGQTPVDSKAQESAKTQESAKAQESIKQESAKEVIKSLADTENMDEANKQALNVLVNGTKKDFVRHVFTNQETGQQRSYAEMRMMYG